MVVVEGAAAVLPAEAAEEPEAGVLAAQVGARLPRA